MNLRRVRFRQSSKSGFLTQSPLTVKGRAARRRIKDSAADLRALLGRDQISCGRFGRSQDNERHSRKLVDKEMPRISNEMGWNYLERATRIELAFSAWEADVLPLNYARVGSIVVAFEVPVSTRGPDPSSSSH